MGSGGSLALGTGIPRGSIKFVDSNEESGEEYR